MPVLLSVIDELYRFAVDSIVSLFSSAGKGGGTGAATLSETVETPITVPVERLVPPATFHSLGAILKEERREPLTAEKNIVMYIGANATPLYMKPTQEFDTVTDTLKYGDMVMVLEQKGRWARLMHQESEGWVLREDLADRAAHVYPEFIVGGENDADHENTLRVRAIIQDTFGGGKIGFPLQAGEYVLYRLLRKGLSIAWPSVRPRIPGMWHSILKGIPGIHMGVSPKTGSVMEYVSKEEIGHVAYVEAVFPDETIHISEANYPDRGIYSERVLKREEWRELRPVFIQVS